MNSVSFKLLLAGCLLTMLAALMGSGVAASPLTRADPVQPGQPCNEPSRIMMTGQPRSAVPFLVCAGTSWQPLGGALSSSNIFDLGSRCSAPDTALVIADDQPNSKAWLAGCRGGKWTIYHP